MYVDDKTIAKRFGVSRATVWRWARTSNFPAPVSLSPGCTRWRLSDVEAWEATRSGRLRTKPPSEPSRAAAGHLK